MKQLFTILMGIFLMSSSQVMAQTLSVTPIPATCLQNGELSWSLDGADPNAMIDYTVDDGDVLTPPITLTATELTGLPAGTYTVTANSIVDGMLSSVSETAVIDDEYTAITFELVEVLACGNNIGVEILSGDLDLIEVVQGPPNFSGTIDNTVNPVIINDVLEGDYQLNIVDICGNTQLVDVTFVEPISLVSIDPFTSCSTGESCDSININVAPQNFLAYPFRLPLTYQVEVIAEDGTSIFLNSSSNIITIPYYDGQTYYYTVTATDQCGVTYTKTETIDATDKLSVELDPNSCNGCFNILLENFRGDALINFTDFPANMAPVINEFNGDYMGECTTNSNGFVVFSKGSYAICSETTVLEPGTYTVEVADECGSYFHTFDIEAIAELSPTALLSAYHCEEGFGTLIADWNNPLESLVFNSFPMAYTGPADLSDCIVGDRLRYGPLPVGTYEIEATDVCGSSYIGTVDIVSEEVPLTSFAVNNTSCGTFEVAFQGAAGIDKTFFIVFFLEWFNPDIENEDGSFGAYEEIAEFNTNNNESLPETFTNIAQTGDFRITRSIAYSAAGCSAFDPRCTETLQEFTEDGTTLEYTSLDGIQCNDGSYTISSEATGLGNLTYNILSIDGVAQASAPSVNPVFENLSVGTYEVEVADDCGSQIREIELVNLPPFTINNSISCIGEEGSLFINGFSFLVLEWFKGGVSVGTGNTLQLADGSFENGDVYTLSISSPNCIMEMVDYVIDAPNCDPCINNPITTTTPLDQAICEGDDATFSISATGDNLSYQWQQVCTTEEPEITTYTSANSNLPFNIVRSVYESNGMLYAGTGDGLAILDLNNTGAGWTVYDDSNGLLGNTVYSVYESNGMLYAGTNSGLGILDLNNISAGWTVYNTANSNLPNNSVIFVYESNGMLYAGVFGGLVILDLDNTGAGWTIYNTANSNLPSNDVISLYESNGMLYAGTSGGIGILDLNNISAGWTVYNTANSNLPTNLVRSVYESNGMLYAGTLGGIGILDLNNISAGWTVYNTSNGLPSNFVSSVYESNGMLYAGTSGTSGVFGGLAILDLNNPGAGWTVYDDSNGLASNSVRSVYESNGQVYLGTDGGIAILDFTGTTDIPGATNSSYTFTPSTTDTDCTYQVVVSNDEGCVVTSAPASLTINEASVGSYEETICFGETALVNGEELGIGVHIQTLTNVLGCDSTVTVTISEYPAAIGSYDETLCFGETALVNGEEFGVGSHTQVLPGASVFSCDSTVNITISEFAATSVDAGTYEAICSEDGIIDLVGSPSGGTWSGAGVIAGKFNPSGLSGFVDITYTVVDVNGCSASATTTIEVEAGTLVECEAEYIPGFIYMGEHNGNFYYCSSSSYNNWYQADAMAQMAGGHLAVINDAAENEFIRANAMTNNVWIGFTDQAMEGNFEWVNGDAVTYTNWQGNEPNNGNGVEHYARLRKQNGKWTDRPYWKKYEFVMEISCESSYECAPAGPACGGNDEISSAEVLTIEDNCQTIVGCNENATNTVSPGNYGIWCGTSPCKDVWYEMTMPSSGYLSIETYAGSLTDAVMAVYVEWQGNVYYVGSVDDVWGSYMPSIGLVGGAGLKLYVRVWGYGCAVGDFEICAYEMIYACKTENESDVIDLNNDFTTIEHTTCTNIETIKELTEAELEAYMNPHLQVITTEILSDRVDANANENTNENEAEAEAEEAFVKTELIERSDSFEEEEEEDESHLESLEANLAFKILKMYPNPVTDFLNIDLYAQTEVEVTFFVYDAAGRRFLEITEILQPGNNTIRLDMYDFGGGIYMLGVVSSDEKTAEYHQFVKH